MAAIWRRESPVPEGGARQARGSCCCAGLIEVARSAIEREGSLEDHQAEKSQPPRCWSEAAREEKREDEESSGWRGRGPWRGPAACRSPTRMTPSGSGGMPPPACPEDP